MERYGARRLRMTIWETTRNGQLQTTHLGSILFILVMMDACVFCRVSLKNGEEITQLREKGCNTVNRTSQTRNDTIVTTPGQKVHQKCRRDYINANSIKKDMREKDVSITEPTLHAISGCDTTSRMFGVSKAATLKKFGEHDFLKTQAQLLCNANAKDDVISAGENIISSLYNGAPYEGLNVLRYRKFAARVLTNKTCVQIHTLPPTSNAASFHSQRAYLQMKMWMNKDNLNPCEWGWKVANGNLVPVTCTMDAAPSKLLNIIRCNLSIADTSEKRFLLIPDVFLEDWTSWSSCSASCGNTGERHRTRGCHTTFGTIHWTKCRIGGEQKEACVGICPQTTTATTVLLGTWNPWGLFSPCDKTCGGGIQFRHRTCGSGLCIGDSLESASCNVHQCPVQSTPAASTTQPVTTAATTGTQWISVTTTTKATTTHKKFFTIRSNK
uniref:Uncharacterized protein n=1 Tax=Magallana gigas TaxID=29159 RepID=A0A8W8HXD6_MAGGI